MSGVGGGGGEPWGGGGGMSGCRHMRGRAGRISHSYQDFGWECLKSA